MNLKALRAFGIIVTQGSLAAAAKHLNLSQPSVSRLISQLEEDLHLTLFYRTKRSLTLTREGEAFYEGTKHIVAGVDEIPRIVEELRQVDQQFKLIVTHKIAQGLISPALALLRQKKPGLRVAVDVEARIRFESLVGIKRFDLAIASLPIPLSTSAVETVPLYRARTEILMPQSHHLAGRKSITAKDLEKEQLIGLWKDQLWRQQVDEFMSAAGVTGNFALETRHVLMSCQLVRDGLGLAFVDRVTAQGVNLDGLVLRPVKPDRWVSFGYICQGGRPLTENASDFIEAIRRVIEAIRSQSLGNAASIQREVVGETAT